jgi:hypothetical protein
MITLMQRSAILLENVKALIVIVFDFDQLTK